MDHLNLDLILDVLAGRAGAEESAHLAECSRCREDAVVWKQRLETLREVEAERLGDAEEHRLRVLYRQLGPSPRRSRLVAELVRGAARPAEAAAVRGESAEMAEFRAADFVATVQILPGGTGGSHEIHGCLLRGGAGVPSGCAVLSGETGAYCDRTDLDEFGEFHFSDVPGGVYHLSWVAVEHRIEIENLSVGEGDDGD